MNYSKIVSQGKTWQNIITEELDTDNKTPIYVLAGRFRTYSLRVLSQNHTCDRMIAYIIEGNKSEGRCLVFFTCNLSINMLEHFSIKKTMGFDKELAWLLTYSLLMRFQNEAKFNIAPYLFPSVIENKTSKKSN